MMIFKTPIGDPVHRLQKTIIIKFNGKRNVVSTSMLNGGYTETLKYVFNRDENPGAGMACKLRASTYKEHLMLIASELGLNPEYTSGISTAASMDNVSIVTEKYKDVSVTAIVTGGVDVNGGRVGDTASYDELELPKEHKNGTINIILEIDARLSPGTLTRAVVTCTEAKTAALQELMAGSNYSCGLATGSGTDGTIVVGNMDSAIHLTNAGKHSKLGEIIGVAVKKAVKEALYKQTDLCPESQHSFFARFKRYGITEDSLWIRYENMIEEKKHEKIDFIHHLHCLDKQNKIVTLSSLLVHLMDQYRWELLSGNEVKEGAEIILKNIKTCLDIQDQDVVINNKEDDFITHLIEILETIIIKSVVDKQN